MTIFVVQKKYIRHNYKSLVLYYARGKLRNFSVFFLLILGHFLLNIIIFKRLFEIVLMFLSALSSQLNITQILSRIRNNLNDDEILFLIYSLGYTNITAELNFYHTNIINYYS